MKIPDANLLIYAYDENAEHHERAKRWQVFNANKPVRE